MTNSTSGTARKGPRDPRRFRFGHASTFCTLRKDQHQAMLDTRAVHGDWRELIFSIDRQWRRTRIFWSGRSPSLGLARKLTLQLTRVL
jgi:hypothetical protein